MKKLLMTIFMILLTFIISGCAYNSELKPETPSNKNTSSIKPQENVVKEFHPQLGGIKLGDSKEQVFETFGTDYQQTNFDEDYSLGEPFVKLSYNNGITVVLGSKSNTVLEIESSSPSVSTNLGFKVGDKAQDVFDNYRSKYKEPESNQGDGKLLGWFIINDQQELVIFNVDKSGSLSNINIKPEARIERIILTNFKYMD